MFSDFRPKSKEVSVGELNLSVQELVIAKRDPIFKIIFAGLDVIGLLKPILDAVKSESKILNLETIAGPVIDTVTRILERDLTKISCIILDTPANRKKIGVAIGDAAFGNDVLEDGEYGYFFSPATVSFIRDSLTVRQEQAVLDAFLETNDFASLIKNYLTLAAKMMPQAREDSDGK